MLHQPLCPTPPHPAPTCRHWGPGGQRGTGSKPGGKTSWRGRTGASLSGATPPGWVSQGTRPPPARPGLLLPFSPLPITSLVPETHSVNRGDSHTTPQAVVESLCTPNAGEGAKGWGRVGSLSFLKEHEGISQPKGKGELAGQKAQPEQRPECRPVRCGGKTAEVW